jgi:LacI family transcriptional regulator
MSGEHLIEPDRQLRATMKDVAALAGVAIKTVSRVINGVPTVAPEIAARVHAAADKLGYRPNLTASNLRRGDGRTSTIGLLLEDVSNPFSAALLRAVEDQARTRGVQLLIGSLDEDPVRERELASTLIDRRVDGLLIVPCGRDHSYLIHERRAGICMVFLDREPRLFDADAVVSDNLQGAIGAVQHLADTGHTRVAYLGDTRTIATARQRFDGYLYVVDRAGLVADEALIRHDLHTAEAAEEATVDLLRSDHPPTALFASQNLVTIGATKALRKLGVQEMVALIGFDDFPMADILSPGITVVTQDATAMGRLAARLLFDRIDGDQSPPETYVIPTRMIVRGSGEIGPAAAVSAAPITSSPPTGPTV